MRGGYEGLDDDLRRRLEGVLEGFERSCPKPMRVDVEAWSAEHPEFAREILEYAVALHQYGAPDQAEPNAEELEAAWRRHRARVRRLGSDKAGSDRHLHRNR